MSIRPQCSRIVLSYFKESSYGVPVIDSNITRRFNPTAPPIFDLTQTRIDDAADIKGHEWAQDVDLDLITAQDISFPFSFPCSSQLAGLLFALAMGGYSVSGAGDPYSHVCKALDACTNDVLPSTSAVVGLIGDTASLYLLKGLMVGDLKLVLDNAGRLVISGTFVSDGTLTAKPAFSIPSVAETQDWFVGAQGDFKTCDYGGSLATVKTILRSFDFTIANNLDVADGRSNVINAGRYLSTLRFGARTYTLVARVDGHPSTNTGFWTDFYNGTVKDVEIPLVISGNDSLTIRMKTVRIASAKYSFDGLRDVLEITYKPYYTVADASPAVVTILNNVAVYLSSSGPSASMSPSVSASRSPSASLSPSASISPSSSPSS